MKRTMATLFCAAFTLPVMAASLQGHSNDVNGVDAGRHGHSAQMESTHVQTVSPATTRFSVTHTGRQGHSAQMESTAMSTDGTAGEAFSRTPTGRQGHSYQMASTEPMRGDADM